MRGGGAEGAGTAAWLEAHHPRIKMCHGNELREAPRRVLMMSCSMPRPPNGRGARTRTSAHGDPAMLVRRVWRCAALGVAALGIGLVARVADAQKVQPESDLERAARLARRGAGVQVGVWQVRGLQEPSGVTHAETPLVEGYFRKGLDRHLALETTVSFWRRTQTAQQSGGLLGGGSEERVASYIIPQITALKLYPFTEPGQRAEPYVVGGAGFALGIDDRESSAGGAFGTASGTAMAMGFGLKGGTGVEWRFSRAFGLSAGARYQWFRFLQELGGDRTYGGFGVDGGLTYRFQF